MRRGTRSRGSRPISARTETLPRRQRVGQLGEHRLDRRRDDVGVVTHVYMMPCSTGIASQISQSAKRRRVRRTCHTPADRPSSGAFPQTRLRYGVCDEALRAGHASAPRDNVGPTMLSSSSRLAGREQMSEERFNSIDSASRQHRHAFSTTSRQRCATCAADWTKCERACRSEGRPERGSGRPGRGAGRAHAGGPADARPARGSAGSDESPRPGSRTARSRCAAETQRSRNRWTATKSGMRTHTGSSGRDWTSWASYRISRTIRNPTSNLLPGPAACVM